MKYKKIIKIISNFLEAIVAVVLYLPLIFLLPVSLFISVLRGKETAYGVIEGYEDLINNFGGD